MSPTIERPIGFSAVTIAEEPFDAVWPDIQDLLRQHWREISAHLDIPLEVDEANYRRMADNGFLIIVTVRMTGHLIADEGRLIGYAIFVLAPNLHYKSCVQATQD